MLTAVNHLQGLATRLATEAGAEVGEGPGPIVPELKELYWGAGSFIVFALDAVLLVPATQAGHGRSLRGIRPPTHEQADAARRSARAEVSDYEAQLAAVKAEAAAKVDAARQTLEAERQEKVKALNAQLAERRAAAQAETDAAKAAVRDQIHAAVADVAGRGGELATGRRPDASVVARVVNEVMAR